MARFRDVMTSFTRNYIPGGPLFAAGALKFQGTEYRTGDPLPVSKMSKARHQRLFITKKADHVPPRKTSPAPTAPPAVTVQPGSVPVIVVGDPAPLDVSQAAAVKAKLGEAYEMPVVDLRGEYVRSQPHPGRSKKR